MISFVKPPGISNFDVRISNSKVWVHRRCYYYDGAHYHSTANPFIVVRLTPNENYFTIYKKGKGYIDHLLLSREEAIILVIARELRHLWHKKIPIRKYQKDTVEFGAQEDNILTEMQMHML
jgi:hypothetical protein